MPWGPTRVSRSPRPVPGTRGGFHPRHRPPTHSSPLTSAGSSPHGPAGVKAVLPGSRAGLSKGPDSTRGTRLTRVVPSARLWCRCSPRLCPGCAPGPRGVRCALAGAGGAPWGCWVPGPTACCRDTDAGRGDVAYLVAHVGAAFLHPVLPRRRPFLWGRELVSPTRGRPCGGTVRLVRQHPGAAPTPRRTSPRPHACTPRPPDTRALAPNHPLRSGPAPPRHSTPRRHIPRSCRPAVTLRPSGHPTAPASRSEFRDCLFAALLCAACKPLPTAGRDVLGVCRTVSVRPTEV